MFVSVGIHITICSLYQNQFHTTNNLRNMQIEVHLHHDLTFSSGEVHHFTFMDVHIKNQLHVTNE